MISDLSIVSPDPDPDYMDKMRFYACSPGPGQDVIFFDSGFGSGFYHKASPKFILVRIRILYFVTPDPYFIKQIRVRVLFITSPRPVPDFSQACSGPRSDFNNAHCLAGFQSELPRPIKLRPRMYVSVVLGTKKLHIVRRKKIVL